MCAERLPLVSFLIVAFLESSVCSFFQVVCPKLPAGKSKSQSLMISRLQKLMTGLAPHLRLIVL